MDFHVRARCVPAKLDILPGAFNPPTLAHLAMADAALDVVDEVLFVLPRAFPHKQYADVGLEERVELLQAAIGGNPRFSLAVSHGGLFVEIASEASEHYAADLFLLCGRDAAERIVSWDYGAKSGIREQLERFRLLVASRAGAYEPPAEIRDRVLSIALDPGMDDISSSELRRRMQAGERWEDLTPPQVAALLAARIDRRGGGGG